MTARICPVNGQLPLHDNFAVPDIPIPEEAVVGLHFGSYENAEGRSTVQYSPLPKELGLHPPEWCPTAPEAFLSSPTRSCTRSIPRISGFGRVREDGGGPT